VASYGVASYSAAADIISEEIVTYSRRSSYG